jgi:hypothetical protein
MTAVLKRSALAVLILLAAAGVVFARGGGGVKNPKKTGENPAWL